MIVIPKPNLEEHIKHQKLDLPISYYLTNFGKDIKDLYLHWHKEFEITLVSGGEGVFYTDLTPIEVKKGDILIIPPFALHSGKPINGFCQCKTLVFSLDLLKTNTADTISLKYLTPIMERYYQFPLIITKENKGYKEILNSFLSILKNFNEPQFSYELLIKAEFFRIFSLFFKYDIAIKDNNYRDSLEKSDKIKSVMEYVKKNYQSKITITEVANFSSYSEHHFCRYFKAQTGMTFIEYLNSIRLNEAAILLSETEKAITDIAYETGFDNLSYFIKIFKKKYIVTPLKYRNYIVNYKTN